MKDVDGQRVGRGMDRQTDMFVILVAYSYIKIELKY